MTTPVSIPLTRTVLAVALATASLASVAQGGAPTPSTPSLPGTPPAPMVAPAPGMQPETPSPSAQPPRSMSPRPGTPIAKGTVNRLLPDTEGRVDGLLLSDGTQIRFPTHMTQELASTVKPGSAVSVEGYREAGGAVRARVITEEASGRSVREHDPAPAAAAPNRDSPAPAQLSAEGRIQQLMRDPAGDVNGVVLDDGSVVRFPPAVRRQFPGMLQPGVAISASGYGAESRYGRALDAQRLAPGGAPQPLAEPPQPGRPVPGTGR